MIARSSRSALSGTVSIPPSKSVAHRLLIASSLGDKPSLIKNVGTSDDVKATINSLNALGAKITLSNTDANVTPIKVVNDNPKLDVGESGSTLRFMLPLVRSLGVKRPEFTMRGRLKDRPNDELIRVLDEHTVNGALRSGVYEIDSSISSQYITGLLLALPRLEGTSIIILKGDVVSKGYLDITEDILKAYSIEFTKHNSCYIIPGMQSYKTFDTKAEGDFSSSSFLFTLGAFQKEGITLKNLNPQSKQGDKVIVDILRDSGVRIDEKNGEYKVSENGKYKPLDVDLENAPDLAPILAVFASKVHGVSKISGIERLRIKESDRISAILDMLKSAKIDAKYEDKVLTINGGNPKSGTFDGYKDHRIVMSSLVLSLLSCDDGESVVSDIECISKSYPNFLSDIISLGGNIECQNGKATSLN